jgi:hypothetical protein
MWLMLFLFLAGPTELELMVRPLVAMRGASVHVRCRVPPHPDNRYLDIGLEGERSSRRQLDGQITHELWIDEVQHCGTTKAYCRVLNKDERVSAQRTQPIRILGCPGQEESSDDVLE